MPPTDLRLRKYVYGIDKENKGAIRQALQSLHKRALSHLVTAHGLHIRRTVSGFMFTLRGNEKYSDRLHIYGQGKNYNEKIINFPYTTKNIKYIQQKI